MRRPAADVERRQDMHVHSTFSDGRASVAENLACAMDRGLVRVCCVDHVRRDTPWVPEFVEAVRAAAARASLRVFVGIEAKLLDRSGRLDLPPERAGVDYVYIADHQVPLVDGPHAPAEVKARLTGGTLQPGEVIDSLVDAIAGAMLTHPASVIAHAFSILPKIGLSERDVPLDGLRRLAGLALRTGAILEIDERWRCPSLRTVRVFRQAGVPIVLSTDSHRVETIGQYAYALGVLDGLDD